MDRCCETKADELGALRSRQRRVLVVVLAVNVVMFVVEFGAGLVAGSSALLADSLDMLGDALVYGFSLYVLEKSLVWRARAALVKGLIMLGFGGGVLVEAAYKLYAPVVPMAAAMVGIGALALAANAFCFALLSRHRSDDINLRSTWLCSRNDLVANVSVLVAAAGVAWLRSPIPDVVVGVAIAGLFLRTAVSVLRDSATELSRSARTITEHPAPLPQPGEVGERSSPGEGDHAQDRARSSGAVLR